nr:DUF1538 domain-containing protein [uncultured Lachnoclostridium sp.]
MSSKFMKGSERLLNALVEKMREALFSVLPITLIVLLLNFTLTPLEPMVIGRFLLGGLLIIIGLAVLLVGVDIGITPIGSLMGPTIVKSKKIWIVAVAGILLGFFISVAEPDLHILAGQVEFVTSGVISKTIILIVVSIGIAVMLALGLIRIVYNIPLYKILITIYMVILGLSFFTSAEFLAISFDASGATTGALTVPFILALAIGVSALKKDSKASEKDSFGLVAIASSGAILSVMIMSILLKTDKITASLPSEEVVNNSFLGPFLDIFPILAKEVMIALLPIIIIFIVFQFISFKLPRRSLHKIFKGIIYTFLGLVIFLVGVNAGFMEVGTVIGYKLASLENKSIIVIVGFVLGLVTILAEPAVYVLNRQIETVTSGFVKRKTVLLFLCIGVGGAVALSVIRILTPEIKLWHYLLPGYIIACAMTFFTPKLFVGIAFDSGGVASGPMTATFILAFTQGAADAIEQADVLIDGFGVIAMVALTPLIALQILGILYRINSKKKGINADG